MKHSFSVQAAILLGVLFGNSSIVGASTVEGQLSAGYGSVEAGQPVLAPFAHVVFCKRYPDECTPDRRPEQTVTLNTQTLAALKRVNAAVNKGIRPKSDAPGPLGDVWNVAPKTGDCDDFAVTKRHRLIGLGFPPSALRLATARTREGDGHAVTIVRTNKGDLVLDNRTDRLTGWAEAGLSLEKLQSGADPQRWSSAVALIAFKD